jgi:hypothetical protein
MPRKRSSATNGRSFVETLYRKFESLNCSKTRYVIFLPDERGLEALQTVMILAIAALCLLVLKVWWDPWSRFFKAIFEILLFQ